MVREIVHNRRFLSLLDQAVISATNMCTSVIIGRTCPKAQLGLYASGLSLVLLLTAIQSAMIAVPYTISRPQMRKEERAEYKGSSILHQMLLVSLGSAGFLYISLRGSGRSSGDLRALLLTLSLVGGIICFRDFARRISYAELHFGFALVLDGILSLLQLLSIGMLAWQHWLTASRALLAVGLASASASAMWLIVNWKTISFSFLHAMVSFRINWALGRWLLASSVLWSLSVDQYPWLITLFRTPVDAALWASGYGVMAFLNPIVLALNNDAAPRISNDYATHGLAGLSRSVTRSATIAGLLTLPVLIFLLIFGSRLVELIYGPKFGGAGPIVALLSVGVWFYAISLSFPYGMLTLKRAEVDFAINLACIASFLAVGIWLVRLDGVLGAAYSFLLVETVALILRVAAFRAVVQSARRKTINTPPEEALTWS
jgi:O-antigen/teichoic acid export membrane protein